ncbi:site-specific integrase [Vineibacter terrae]|uniref:Site-specific integrase n=1 Tax=Vineibacter terrae TaxID=2586908 RepID=A0A5C8P906_9HYPH|nr:tyrosine-type recombinase/integrase [Vineibacter terrae]TXL70141.1 site-specific integrase [Vineibacter terrae]
MPENLYRRGKTWWGRAQVAGDEHRRSLRTRDRTEARRRLTAWLEDLNRAAYAGEERHTWQEAVVRFTTEVLPDNVKPKTATRYLVSLRQLDALLRDRLVDRPESLPADKRITRTTIADIVSERKKSGATNATIRRDLTAASAVLKACTGWGWRDDNPAKEWDRSHIKERRAPILLPTADEITAAIAAVPATMGQMMALAWRTGMREDEIVTLEHPQVHLPARIDLTKTKTNRPRAIPLTGPITDLAVGTIAGTVRHLKSKLVFWHGDGAGFANFASNFAAQRRSHGIRFRFHHLRHRFAVDYLRAGGNIYDLQQILGHASIKTTELYLDYLTPEEKEQAMHGPAQNPAQVQRFGTDNRA